MAKAGSIKKITATDKTFAGSGVEGQKDQGSGTGDKEPDTIPFCFQVLGSTKLMNREEPTVEETSPESPVPGPGITVITGEHVLAILRKQGHQV